MIIERYRHVLHIVSGVEGKLSAGKTPYDLNCRDGPKHGGCARRFRPVLRRAAAAVGGRSY